MGKLLLHSLTFYGELIRQLAGLTQNPNAVEIGSQDGEVSVLLADSTAARSGALYVVEPHPSPLLQDLVRRRDTVTLVEGLSPHALRDVPTAGLYVIDGDHNYYVVRGELDAIFGREDAQGSIVVMHDVGWPWARRDMYYDPTALPKDAVHEFSYARGVRLDDPELAPPGQGFRSKGAYAIALQEGGPCNGVLTAVEDTLAENTDLRLLISPLVFGLAVIGSTANPVWGSVMDVMRPYTDNPSLAEMERNRLTLFLEVLALQDQRVRARTARAASRLRGARSFR